MEQSPNYCVYCAFQTSLVQTAAYSGKERATQLEKDCMIDMSCHSLFCFVLWGGFQRLYDLTFCPTKSKF